MGATTGGANWAGATAPETWGMGRACAVAASVNALRSMRPESSLFGALGAGTLGRDEDDPDVRALSEKSTELSFRAPDEAVAGAAKPRAAAGEGAAELVAKSRSLPAVEMPLKRSAPLRCGGCGNGSSNGAVDMAAAVFESTIDAALWIALTTSST